MSPNRKSFREHYNVDGPNLYLFGDSSPLSKVDPQGTATSTPSTLSLGGYISVPCYDETVIPPFPYYCDRDPDKMSARNAWYDMKTQAIASINCCVKDQAGAKKIDEEKAQAWFDKAKEDYEDKWNQKKGQVGLNNDALAGEWQRFSHPRRAPQFQR